MAGERIEYDNQFTTAFELLESYRDVLRTALSRTGLSRDSVDYVSKRFCADKGLIFSLQPAYQPSNLPFHEFCRKVGFSEHITSAMRERFGPNFHLFRHQEEAISAIQNGIPTVVATGTGSGKTESFLLPILNHCLKSNAPGIKSILLYPMNALANDQIYRLSRYASNSKITFGILTGATPEDPPEDADAGDPENRILSRREMCETPPDILLTNYVMLERLLTARKWRPIIDGCRDSLAYIVLDELHSYRGTKATHLMFLLKRLRKKTETCPLLIGASATLAQEGGYISGTTFDQDALDDFLRSVLDVEEYRLVTPDHEVEQTEPMAWPTTSSIPDHEIRDSADSPEKCRLIGDLLGESVPVSIWLSDKPFWTSEIGDKLHRHPFLVALKDSLQKSGAKTFAEITYLYRELCPREISGDQAALTVKAWLNALSIIATNFSDKRPALDLRLHIFLRGLTGFLHRCLSCESFHPHGSDICPECGSPLFFVDREDVHTCVAKVRGRVLSAVLDREEDDGPDTFFIKVRHFKHSRESGITDGIRCTHAVGIGAESIQLDNVVLPFTRAPGGELQLVRHDIQSLQEIYKTLIVLADPIHPREHLRNLVLTILQQLPQGERRLLGFIDDRERASHDAMAISDELVSRFFEVILASIAPEIGPKLSIDQALDAIKAYVIDLVEKDMLDDVGKNVFAEIELWFFRLIGEPVRFAPSRLGLLAVKELDDYEPLEQRILDLFLSERAIDFRCQNPMPESRYIKFQKYWALNKRQIYCDPAARPKSQEEATCISLSPNSREYSEIVLQAGEMCETPERAREREIACLRKKAGSDAILRAIESLAEKGVIYRTSETVPYRYSLNPEHVLLCMDDIEEVPDRYSSIRDDYLFLAGSHSSELTSPMRREVEDQFKRGRVNFLLATPTLEMGIDIGDLRHVMMIGVPPMPSNYAQRAGRAGRRGRSSLVVCYCSHDKAHDRHYFQNPKAMINGLITPPSLHEPTLEIAKKHARAIILADYVDNGRTMREFLGAYDQIIAQRMPTILHMFTSRTTEELQTYFSCTFRQECEEQLEAALASNVSPSQYFYNEAYLPDYGFHHDSVQVWEKETYDETLNAKGAVSPMETDYISEREQELWLDLIK